MFGGKEKSRGESWPVETFPPDTCAVKVLGVTWKNEPSVWKVKKEFDSIKPRFDHRLAFFVNQLPSSDLNYVTLTIENVKILTDNIDDDIDIDAVVWSVIQFCQHFAWNCEAKVRLNCSFYIKLMIKFNHAMPGSFDNLFRYQTLAPIMGRNGTSSLCLGSHGWTQIGMICW